MEKYRARDRENFIKNRDRINAQKRGRYAANPEKHIKNTSERILKRQAEVNVIKERTPCKDCGSHFPAVCMDFDHMGNKLKAVSSMIRSNASREKIFEEIAKCEVVCSNCHRIRTQNRFELCRKRYC
jgi:hypothetical protein